MNVFVLCSSLDMLDGMLRWWPSGESTPVVLTYTQSETFVRQVENRGLRCVAIDDRVRDLNEWIRSAVGTVAADDFKKWVEMPGHALGCKLAIPLLIHELCPVEGGLLLDDDMLYLRWAYCKHTWVARGVMTSQFRNPIGLKLAHQLSQRAGYEDFTQFDYTENASDNGAMFVGRDFDVDEWRRSIVDAYSCPVFFDMGFANWRARDIIIATLYRVRTRCPLVGSPYYRVYTNPTALPKKASTLRRASIIHYVAGRHKLDCLRRLDQLLSEETK